MPSIQKRGPKQWRARYRDADGKEHAKHFTRQIDAKQWLDDVTAAVVTGTYVDPDRSRVTVGEWVATWLDGKADLAETTRTRYESVIKSHIAPKWQKTPLAALEHARLQTWVTELKDSGMAARSVRKTVGVLSSALDVAVRDKRLASNPAKGLSLPRATATKRRYLTAREVEHLADAAGERGRLIVFVLAYSGIRWGELAGLKVKCIDALRGRLLIEETVVDVDGKLTTKPPKDFESRSVPVSKFLIAELEAHVNGKRPDELVFSSARAGTPLRHRVERRAWFNKAVESIGADGLTPHGLRHTAASIAISAGASVLNVQRMLGHASAVVTLDTYADLFDTDLDAVADRMESVRSKAAADYLRTRGENLRAVG